MNAQPVVPIRIVVVARPGLARQVEAILRGEGHEVYRTPDAAGVVALAARVRPHLVIFALDLPWADSIEAPRFWVERLRPVPVLLIGEIGEEQQLSGIPRLPGEFNPICLLAAVAELLTASEGAPGA